MDEINRCLQEDGLSAEASAEERQRHLWRVLQRSEENRLFSVRELQSLQAQRADEMEEVSIRAGFVKTEVERGDGRDFRAGLRSAIRGENLVSS